MRFSTMRRLVSTDKGLTLVELMIVILILVILSGIGIFAIRPFQRAATEACIDAELTIDDVKLAAERAGIKVEDLELDPDDMCLPIVMVLGAAVENADSVVHLPGELQVGHTIVAVSAHRSNTAGPTPRICSGSQYTANGTCTTTTGGWQLVGYHNGPLAGSGSNTTGRGVAVWTKQVQANEPTTIRAAWVHPDGSQWPMSKSLLIGVFNRPLTATGVNFTDSGTSGVSSLTLGTASGASGPAVVLSSLAARAVNSTPTLAPCELGGPSAYHCVVFDGVPGITKVSHAQPSSVFNMMAWATVRSGAGPHTVSATWERNMYSVGFTVVLSLYGD